MKADEVYAKLKKMIGLVSVGINNTTSTQNPDGSVTITINFTSGSPLSFTMTPTKGDKGVGIKDAQIKEIQNGENTEYHLILIDDKNNNIDAGNIPISSVGSYPDTTNLATKSDLKTGRVIGNNCHGKEKVELFRNKYPKSIINSMYTDSKNDYPLIREAKKGYLVCKNDIYDYDDFFKNKKSIFEKYHEIISYLIFGVLTVFINIIVKYIMWGFFCDPKIDNYFNQQFPVDLSWFIAVLFAYLTNKKYVFMSNNGNNSIEFISFFLSRIFTLILEKVLTFIFVTKLSITEGVSFLFITLFIQFIVIVLNYVCSKIFVFKKK